MQELDVRIDAACSCEFRGPKNAAGSDVPSYLWSRSE